MEEKIMSVLRRMQDVINDEQLRTLQSTLNMVFSGCELVENTELRVVDRSWQNTTGGERIMNIIEQARKGREMLEEQADSMTDEEILTAPTFVKHWKANTFYRTGKRLNYNGIIYKVLQDHTLQAD